VERMSNRLVSEFDKKTSKLSCRYLRPSGMNYVKGKREGKKVRIFTISVEESNEELFIEMYTARNGKCEG
jgi:hypothetical protein